jgi:hypothetical protein
MFEPSSRYYILAEATYISPEGREITYKRRRFLPQGEQIPVLREVVVAGHDRLDQIAAQQLGDPLQFWQICDANDALNPFDLVQQGVLRIPLPQFQEEE